MYCWALVVFVMGIAAFAPVAIHRAFRPSSFDALRATHVMIPANTTCEEAYWCDSTQICARVCRPGTVRVDPWLRETLDAEWRLAAGDSFCNAQLLGTHNSAITATSGFGVRDAYFEASLRGAHLIGQHAVLATNNQYFSITDQLELGARKIEVDAHYFGGELRVAHCGNLRLAPVDAVFHFFNWLLNLFGGALLWDSAEIGCNPSMSSMPWADAPSFESVVREIQQWMDQPRNHGTFLVIYIDATSNISSWGKAPQLLDILDDVLGWEHFVNRTQILGPEALRPLRYQVPLVPWPTINELMSQGKRFLLLTRTNLRSEYAFMQPEICSTTEVGPSSMAFWPDCTFEQYRGILHRQSPRAHATGHHQPHVRVRAHVRTHELRRALPQQHPGARRADDPSRRAVRVQPR